MASPSLLLRLPLVTVIVLLVLSATTTTARPCRTFLISSYSFRNPSTNTFATITEIRSLTPFYINKPSFATEDIFFHRLQQQHHDHHHHTQHQNLNLEIDPRASLPRAPLGFSTANYDFSSLRDRTEDILSVVLALLFGLGCGVLTAATMYLAWSVFSGRRKYRAANYDDFSSSSSDDDSDIESPKKMGYVKIPAAEAAAAPVPPPAPAPLPPPAKDSV